MSNQYTPDVVFPPGDTIRELMQSRGMDEAALAESLGMPSEALTHLLDGGMCITEELASRLEAALGVNAAFWNLLEKNFRGAE